MKCICIHGRAVVRGFLVFLAVSMAGSPAGGDDWPTYRGPKADGSADGDGVFNGSTPGIETIWKRSLGSGYSGLSVAGDRMVTMYSDGAVDHAVALRIEDGKELWSVEVGPTYPGHDGSHTGPIATPMIADGRVVLLGPWGRLLAVDLGDGDLIWSVDLVKDHGAMKPHYGFGASPAMIDGILVVPMGVEEGPSVAGFDPATGERVWASGDDKVNFQTPIPIVVDGREMILATGAKFLYGIDPTTGEQLWQYEHGGSGARGVESLTPVKTGDDELFLSFRDNESTAIRLVPEGEGVAVEEVWVDRSIRNSYNVPVYHDGYLYAFSSRFLTCVDAGTGEGVWKSRQPGDGFLILVDGHLVIQTKAGTVHVVEASPEGYLEVTSTEVFGDLAWTAPSFAGGDIYVRSLGEVARIGIGEARGEAGRASSIVVDSEFADFLERVAAAEDKAAEVDAWLEAQTSFPVIEGSDLVHFVYRGEGDDLALAGDLIGARQESPMTHVEGTDLHFYSARLMPESRVSYVFVRDYEQLVDPRNPNRSPMAVVGRDMEVMKGEEIEMSWVALPGWRQPQHLAPAPEEARGTIERQTLEIEGVPDGFEVDVYLPVGYDADGDGRYPVAYVHGGASAEGRGQLTNSLDNLVGEQVKPAIVVLIRQGGNPFGPDPYAAMVAEQLVPFIDETYRTVAEPSARANVGAGFGGFFALYTTFKTGMATHVAAQSPFMLTTMEQILEPVLKTADEMPLDTVYVEWGAYDLRNPQENWDMIEVVRDLDANLRQRGYETVGGEVLDGTGWPSWKNRSDLVFEAVFPAEEKAK